MANILIFTVETQMHMTVDAPASAINAVSVKWKTSTLARKFPMSVQSTISDLILTTT